MSEEKTMKNTEQKIPALRFPEFSGEWEEKRLGEMGFFTSGTGFSEKEQGGVSGIPFYKVSDMNMPENIQIMQKANNYVSDKQIIDNRYKVIKKPSIIFAKVGAAIFLERKRVANNFLIDNNMMSFTPAGNIMFFFQLFQTIHLSKFAQVGALPSYNASDVSSIRIIIPTSEDEQRQIADFLSAVDKRLHLLKDKKTKLEEYKRGVMQRIFSQELRFTRPDGSAYPDWGEKRLDEVLFEHKSRNLKLEVDEVFSVAKEKGVINQIEHLGRSYAADNISNYKIVYPFDLIYTKSPTSGFPFGIIKQNKTDRTGVVSTLYGVFRPNNKFIGYYLDAYFSSEIRTYNYLVPLVQKGAKNTMNINNKTFLNGAKISLPSSEDEQRQIADFLSAIDNKIALLTKQIESTEQYKKGLLQQMFV